MREKSGDTSRADGQKAEQGPSVRKASLLGRACGVRTSPGTGPGGAAEPEWGCSDKVDWVLGVCCTGRNRGVPKVTSRGWTPKAVRFPRSKPMWGRRHERSQLVSGRLRRRQST